jgi:hypothetical protein
VKGKCIQHLKQMETPIVYDVGLHKPRRNEDGRKDVASPSKGGDVKNFAETETRGNASFGNHLVTIPRWILAQ